MSRSYRICPTCRRSMLITRFEEHEVDQCPECAGIWFDAVEISAEHANPETKSQRAPCPVCDTQMQAADLLEGHSVKVDVCPELHGTFVAHDKLEHVRHSEDIQKAITEVSQKISAKTWFFQFFTRMPIEYNIQPRAKPVITQALIAINMLVFALQWDGQLSQYQFLQWGFIPAQLGDTANLYSLITSQFLHGSWMHLLGNMYFLYIIGDNVEDVLGKFKYLLVYLSLGVIGCLGHWAIEPNNTIPMVGASGAISGLFGIYLVLFRRAMLTQMIVVFQLKLPVWGYFLIWFGLNLFGQLLGGEGVAYMAHIGGFIAGIAFAKLTYPQLVKHYPIIGCLNSDHFTAKYKR